MRLENTAEAQRFDVTFKLRGNPWAVHEKRLRKSWEDLGVLWKATEAWAQDAVVYDLAEYRENRR
jgi:hypothetical protein